MPQLQNIVLTDRQATPVSHTFVPTNIDAQGVGTCSESSGVPIGENKLSVSHKVSGKKHKCEVRLAVPIVQNQTINGITSPVVVRTGSAFLTFIFDESSSEQERKDIVGMLQSSLDATKVLVNDTIVKLQGVY